MSRSLKIIVTGDSGFIGSYLTPALAEHGHTLYGLDLDPVKKVKIGYQAYTGDIRDPKAWEQLPRDADAIIHLAAAHKDFGITQEEYYAVNEEGMRRLTEFAASRGIRSILFYSSVAVYGENQPSTEETEPAPVNHYGGSKLAGEKVLTAWAKGSNDRSAVIVRPAVVFGPRNVANIFKLIRQVCDGKFLWVGDGSNVKSVAYVENLVAATLFLLERMKPGAVIYNYSDDPQMTTRGLVGIISAVSGQRVSSFGIPLFAAMAVASLFDLAGALTGRDFPITAARLKKFNTSTEHRAVRIRQEGFVPAISIEEGIRRNVEWYRHHKASGIVITEHAGE